VTPSAKPQSRPKSSPALARAAKVATFVLAPLCCLQLIAGAVIFVWSLLPLGGGATPTTPQANIAVAEASSTAATLPPAVLPTLTPLSCGQSTLILGATTYRIEPIARADDGSLSAPSDTPDVAYWVVGTDTNPVFVLSPTPNNLTLGIVLKGNDLMTVLWADCHIDAYYVVTPFASGLSMDAVLSDQPTQGITVFFQSQPSVADLVIRGNQTEVLVVVTDTPAPPGAPVIEAEVTFLETLTSSDGATIQIGVSVLNYGASAFTISTADVSLTPENVAPIAPTGSILLPVMSLGEAAQLATASQACAPPAEAAAFASSLPAVTAGDLSC
jgi:hypothetical protein